MRTSIAQSASITTDDRKRKHGHTYLNKADVVYVCIFISTSDRTDLSTTRLGGRVGGSMSLSQMCGLQTRLLANADPQQF